MLTDPGLFAPSESLLLTSAMLLSFCTGFFHLLSLLHSEDIVANAEYAGSSALNVLSELFDGASAALIVLFIYFRLVQLMSFSSKECEDQHNSEISYFMSEKDEFGVQIKCSIYAALSSLVTKRIAFAKAVSAMHLKHRCIEPEHSPP